MPKRNSTFPSTPSPCRDPSPAPRAPAETPWEHRAGPWPSPTKSLGDGDGLQQPHERHHGQPDPHVLARRIQSGGLGPSTRRREQSSPWGAASTHLHHALEGDGAVGRCQGEAWWPEGWQALGDAAGEPEGLGAHHLEGVSHQASKQDDESVACCQSGESNPESCPEPRTAGGGQEMHI